MAREKNTLNPKKRHIPEDRVVVIREEKASCATKPLQKRLTEAEVNNGPFATRTSYHPKKFEVAIIPSKRSLTGKHATIGWTIMR